jgi:hypothetical protein
MAPNRFVIDVYILKKTKDNVQLELPVLSERTKLGLLGVLLLLMVGILVFTAVNTLEAAQDFQQQYSAVKKGEVSAIHPWMTVHVVSHLYRVPENYLYHALDLTDSKLLRHSTLYDISSKKKQPVNTVIQTLQRAILAYRKAHPNLLTPTPSVTPRSKRHAISTPGGTPY